MEQRLVDLTLSINSGSTAVLHLLHTRMLCIFGQDNWFSVDNAKGQPVETKTYPWYNGRERGYVIEMQVGLEFSRKSLFIAFAECRGSDDVVVESWEDEESFNPVCTADLRTQAIGQQATARIYEERTTHRIVDAAASHIVSLMEQYNERCMLLQDVSNVLET